MDENPYAETPYPLEDSPVWDYHREKVSFRWKGNLLVTVYWCQIDGQWEAVGIRVHVHPKATDPRRLQRKDLDIKMGDVLDYAAGRLRHFLEAVSNPEIEHWSLDYDASGEVITTVTSIPNPAIAPENAPKCRGRPPLSLEMLQEVAKVYDEAYENGQDPTEAVQKRWGLKTRNAASSRIWKARKRNLLPPTIPGRIKGHGLPKPKEET